PALSKGPVERKVVRIVTPGTITDAQLLPERDDRVLLAVSPGARRIGLAWMVVASGECWLAEVAASQFLAEFDRLQPAELVLPESMDPASLPGWLNEAGPLQSQPPLARVADWLFDAQRAKRTLDELLQVADAGAFGVDEVPDALGALGALLDYVGRTQGISPTHLQAPRVHHGEDYLIVDPVARRNLELVETLRGEPAPTLLSVLERCASSAGARTLRRWLQLPLRRQADAAMRHRQVGRLLEADPTGLRRLLARSVDFERIAGRIALRSVRPRELAALRDACASVEQIADWLRGVDPQGELFGNELAGLVAPPAQLELLAGALAEEPAALVRDGGVFRAGHDATLDELRAIDENCDAHLAQMELQEREQTGIANLKLGFNSVHGFYIEVSRGQSERVPEHYRRRQTLKNAERYITPELKAFEDKALSARERALARERELYEQLLDALAPSVQAWQRIGRALGAIDVLACFADRARELGWVAPQFSTLAGIEIRAGRHPVVQESVERFVPNDCVLDERRRTVLLTGPNMGGRSTYMRQVALIVLLAHIGSFVPADACVLGPLDRIFTRIGASDDLAGGRSTFMVEMTEAAAILHAASEHSLVLMDEIGRGTSTFDGLALAHAIASRLLSHNRSFVLFATHYFELTQLAERYPQAINRHLAAAEHRGTIAFLHEVRDGPANRSYGLQVARLAGLPTPVVRAAGQLLEALEARAREHDSQIDLFGQNPAQGNEPQAAQQDDDPAEAEQNAREVIERLSRVDPDQLSARAALDLLYELKAALKR
ncbi:MAG: DNA mismatch repair protein MutS, partial [Quisquiliibacterium sp.]